MEKLEIVLQKLIDKEGFNDAKSLLGLTTIDLIQKSNCRIDLTMANDIIRDLFELGSIPRRYKNCELSYNSFSGVIDWVCDWSDENYKGYSFEETNTMATLFWEGKNGIPVDTELYRAVDSNNEGILLSDENFTTSDVNYTFIEWDKEFNNLASYDMWIRRFYLPKVHSVIKKHLDYYRVYSD
jgi:hypothetical protein